MYEGQDWHVANLSVGNKGIENPGKSELTEISVYCPKSIPFAKEPAYGTLRFMYAASVDVNDDYIASDSFDGWIYPNGETYNIDPNQFNGRTNPFVTNEGSNPFISGNRLMAPTFDKFIKANPFIESTICRFEELPHHTAVAPHQHSVNDLSIRLRLGVDISKTSLAIGSKANIYNKNCTHWGGKKGHLTPTWKKAPASVTISGGGLKLSTQPTGENPPPEVKPSRQKVAVMIYVGGRKKEYERIYAQ